MKKNDRSNINPFTGKKHFNILNDDKFLNQSYNEYNNLIKQYSSLDGTVDGKLVSDISQKLINSVENYLSQIGRLDYTQNYYDWEFHLVKEDTVNAFCMPGGKILVYSGILSIADNEQSLAFILAHEMAHALLDHSRTQISAHTTKNVATTGLRLGAFGLGVLGWGDVGSLVRTATDVADIGSEYFLMKPWGRDQELEADKLGMMIIKWAGYDINEIPNFWKKMKKHSANNFDFFSTHPTDNKRINAMKKLVLDLPNQNLYNSFVLSEDNKASNVQSNVHEKLVSIGKNFEIPVSSGGSIPSLVSNTGKFDKNMGNKTVNDFSQAVYCTNCGNKIEKNDLFCTNCGNKVMNDNLINEDKIMYDSNLKDKNIISNLNDNGDIISENDENLNGTKFCTNCGEKINQNAEICPKCGVRIGNNLNTATKSNPIPITTENNDNINQFDQISVNTKYCSNCGKVIDKNAEICPKCGVRIENFQVSAEKNNEHMALTICAYIFAFLIPIVGFILSIILLTRDNEKAKKNGTIALIISLVIMILGFLLVAIPFMGLMNSYSGYY
ncbi:MAG: M48 family metalloprotease [Methanobrevibacter sp.]|jgi:Zn-dependent protease with chaperone function/rRNA maturation endonuclease Nob1|nr:M48 family metalloprotease [Candidatus Methanoflexus mossambicus]